MGVERDGSRARAPFHITPGEGPTSFQVYNTYHPCAYTELGGAAPNDLAQVEPPARFLPPPTPRSCFRMEAGGREKLSASEPVHKCVPVTSSSDGPGALK
jgi:hypothetical protein